MKNTILILVIVFSVGLTKNMKFFPSLLVAIFFGIIGNLIIRFIDKKR